MFLTRILMFSVRLSPFPSPKRPRWRSDLRSVNRVGELRCHSLWTLLVPDGTFTFLRTRVKKVFLSTRNDR